MKKNSTSTIEKLKKLENLKKKTRKFRKGQITDEMLFGKAKGPKP